MKVRIYSFRLNPFEAYLFTIQLLLNLQSMAMISPASSNRDILIKGAREHNLKNVTVSIPRNKLIIITGVSGSGKSSLAIDTLFAEGQRRYAESLSSYARQFLNRMNKPDVDHIQGLCPAIAIEQKVITRTPRSTVGSMTEIYDYLRLLYARVGRTVSPVSGKEVKKQDVSQVVDYLCSVEHGTKLMLLARFPNHPNRDIKEELSILMQKGFSRLYRSAEKKGKKEIPAEILRIEDVLEDEKLQKKLKTVSNLYILIDRLVSKVWNEEDLHRLADSTETAFSEGEGEIWIEVNQKDWIPFSRRFELDGIRFEEPSPNLFSFNNSYGACPTCEGYSQILGVDEDLVIPDPSLSVFDGAVAPWKGEKLGWWREQFVKAASKEGFPIHKPVCDLSKTQLAQLWDGVGKAYGIHDFFAEVEANLYKVQYRVLLSRYRGRTTCTDCEGYRLRKEALYVKIGNKHIGELCIMPVKDLKIWLEELKLNENENNIAQRILLELHTRIATMIKVGLGYLTLNRLANSLSGGESQRIQLTRSLGSNLTDSLYILDEPSIGLHPRDTANLIQVLKELRDLGNTVLVVEHDEMMMREADYIIDMGPYASTFGGEVVAAGTYGEIIKINKSLTGRYLSGQLSIGNDEKPRPWKHSIIVQGARQHNLKNIDVEIPLNILCVVSGVSGSGKTTLIKSVLYPALQKLKGIHENRPGIHKSIQGDVDRIAFIELVDQNPIGKSSRSNPVTYIKAYDEIRSLFSEQPLSRIRGFQPKHFSFNVDGGRCDTCKGEGEQIVEMQFLADVHLTCEQCKGKRFKDEVLEVTYQEKSIHDVLSMSVDEALIFFREEKDLVKKLSPLQEVGLGYIQLGQSSDTLSGGEAQRVKLASFLGRGSNQGSILFIFDEPTTGLHFHDISKLLRSFRALIEKGHSVLVIEHNTDVIKRSDWVIDLGPEAGESGGNLVFTGTPLQLIKCRESITGKYI
jgi:excinuclease ABC subunit A